MTAPAGHGSRRACCEKSGRHEPPLPACRQCRCVPPDTDASPQLELSALDTCYISTPLCKQAGRVRREAGCGQMKARCWLDNAGGGWVQALPPANYGKQQAVQLKQSNWVAVENGVRFRGLC